MEDFSPRRRLFAADTLFLDCRDLEISSVKCEDRGIDLTYSVDGKTPYGSCVQIKLALNTGMAFKVFLINFLFFSIFLFALTVLWIRIRIGSGFNDFLDPDSESGSGSMDKKNEEKTHFSLTF
jgi:hypothetical protein